jgi:hypothetical protein
VVESVGATIASSTGEDVKPVIIEDDEEETDNYGVKMARRIFSLATDIKAVVEDADGELTEEDLEATKDNLTEIAEIAIELEDFVKNHSLPTTSEVPKAVATTTVEEEGRRLNQEAKDEARRRSDEKQSEARRLAAGFTDVRV